MRLYQGPHKTPNGISQKTLAPQGLLLDPEGLLSERAAAEITTSVEAFRRSSGHWMMIVVSSRSLKAGLTQHFDSATNQTSQTPVGIIYRLTRDKALGELMVVAPSWRKVANVGWIPMFPQRLMQKFGDLPFEARVVDSARYLAETFPDKIAFMLKPDSGPIGQDSKNYARTMMKGFEYFCYFIILFTFFRTFFPARVKDEDTDDFSNELRRLKGERQIW